MEPGLEDIESNRRAAYAPKLAHLSEQWRVSEELLNIGVRETARAERIMLGTSLVHQARADAMQAMYMDVLFDDELNSVVDERKQKSLYEERIHLGFESLNQNLSGKKKKKKKSIEQTAKGGMLTSLVRSQTTIAKQFAEDALLVTTHIARETSAFRKEHQEQVQEMIERGNTMLKQLESVEKEACTAWDDFLSSSVSRSLSMDRRLSGDSNGRRSRSWRGVKSLEGDFSPDIERNTSEPIPSIPEPKTFWKKKPLSGSELQVEYGLAVVKQTNLWNNLLPEMTDLLESAAKLEAERQEKVLEFLKDYVPGQRRLFSSAAASQTQVVDELQVENHNRLYPDVSRILEEDDPASEQDKSEAEIFQAKEIPLTSNLVASIKVVERRESKSTNWSRVLAVVTEDEYLHLFKLPPTSSASLSNPEKVFMELLPKNTPLFPSKRRAEDDTEVSSTSSGSGEHSVKDFTTLESWFLPNCNVNVFGKKGREIEVTNARSNGGFLSRKKRLLMRIDPKSSMEDKVAWMDILRLTRTPSEEAIHH